MEILKPGRTNTADQECPKCGCVFRYNVRTDTVFVRSYKGGPITSGYPKGATVELTTCVRCPCCNEMLPTADGKPSGSFLS